MIVWCKAISSGSYVCIPQSLPLHVSAYYVKLLYFLFFSFFFFFFTDLYCGRLTSLSVLRTVWSKDKKNFVKTILWLTCCSFSMSLCLGFLCVVNTYFFSIGNLNFLRIWVSNLGNRLLRFLDFHSESLLMINSLGFWFEFAFFTSNQPETQRSVKAIYLFIDSFCWNNKKIFALLFSSNNSFCQIHSHRK